MNRLITVQFLNLLLVTLLLLSHCSAASAPVSLARPTASATVAATNIPTITSTPVIEPAITPITRTVSVSSTTISTTDWINHRLTDIGLELLLPAGWKVLRGEGFYFARPASVQSEIDPAAFALVLRGLPSIN